MTKSLFKQTEDGVNTLRQVRFSVLFVLDTELIGRRTNGGGELWEKRPLFPLI